MLSCLMLRNCIPLIRGSRDHLIVCLWLLPRDVKLVEVLLDGQRQLGLVALAPMQKAELAIFDDNIARFEAAGGRAGEALVQVGLGDTESRLVTFLTRQAVAFSQLFKHVETSFVDERFG